MKHAFIFLMIFIACVNTFAQQRTITGKVVAFDSIPLQNIVVETSKSKGSTLTDINGSYSLSCTDKDVILFSSKTFGLKKIKVSKIDGDTFNLTLDFIDMDQNLNIAIENEYFGEDDLPEIEAYIERNAPNYCNYTDIYAVIQGNCPGVELNPELRIRGMNSDTPPLFLVDGVEVNSIKEIRPCDVREIKVLKDSFDVSAYGSKGAAGIISIKTKRGTIR